LGDERSHLPTTPASDGAADDALSKDAARPFFGALVLGFANERATMSYKWAAFCTLNLLNMDPFFR
jgi:hypothetical protein